MRRGPPRAPGLFGGSGGGEASEPEWGAGWVLREGSSPAAPPLPPPTSSAPQLIYMHWVNTVVNYCGPFEYEVGYCEKLKNFLETNLEWMQEQMQRNKGSAYWHQVGVAPVPIGRGGGRGCFGDLTLLWVLLL